MRARNIWGQKYLWTTKGHASNCYIITKIYLFISEKTKAFLQNESGKRGALRYALQTTPILGVQKGEILYGKYSALYLSVTRKPKNVTPLVTRNVTQPHFLTKCYTKTENVTPLVTRNVTQPHFS
jgi:hypothetical protein